MIGIYSIRNLRNGNCYVGQSVDIHRRFRHHKKGGSKSTRLVSHALAKYGKAEFAFEVLEICPEDNLHARECHWITALDCVAPNGYNLTTGGEGSRHSEETRKKQSESLKGHVISEETRRKISEANKGHIPSEEARRKASKSLKGRKFSEEHRRKIGEANKGREITPETRKKISDSLKGNTPWNKGKPRSAETRRKISESLKAKKRKADDRQLKLF